MKNGHVKPIRNFREPKQSPWGIAGCCFFALSLFAWIFRASILLSIQSPFPPSGPTLSLLPLVFWRACAFSNPKHPIQISLAWPFYHLYMADCTWPWRQVGCNVETSKVRVRGTEINWWLWDEISSLGLHEEWQIYFCQCIFIYF